MSRDIRVFVGGPFSAAMNVESDRSFDRQLRSVYERVHQCVLRTGAQLLSAHIADHYGDDFDEKSFVPRDRAWSHESDLYLALLPLNREGVPYRSDGTFVEIGLSVAYGRRVLVVLEGQDHPSQSHFVRNLSAMPEVRVAQWEEFFRDPDSVIEQAVAELAGDLLRSKEGLVLREQTTDPDEVLCRLALQSAPETIVVRDKTLTVLPGVFSPRFSHAPDLMIENMEVPAGANVLDLGCGSGILGLFALYQGAGTVTSLDRNPAALQCAQLNFKNHGFQDRTRVLASDVYGGLSEGERFDVILLSPPYWDRQARSPLEGACFDEGYQFLRAAFSGLGTHLSPNGRVFVGFANQGDVSLLSNLIERSGLAVRRLIVQSPTMPSGHVRLFWDLRLA